jgi:hypothetical protein
VITELCLFSFKLTGLASVPACPLEEVYMQPNLCEHPSAQALVSTYCLVD